MWKKYLTDTGQKLHISASTTTFGVITVSFCSLVSLGQYKLDNKVYDVSKIFKKHGYWSDTLVLLTKLPTLQYDVESLKRDVVSLQALAGVSKKVSDKC